MPQTEWLEITEIYFLTALEAGSPKARCWQGLAPSETSREDAPSLPFPASGGPRCSYITAVFACLPWPSSCGSSSTFLSPGRMLGHIDLGAILMISSNLITFKSLCFPIRSHSHILAVRASDLFSGPDSAPPALGSLLHPYSAGYKMGTSCWIFSHQGPLSVLWLHSG